MNTRWRRFVNTRLAVTTVCLLGLGMVAPVAAQTGGGYDLTWNVVGGGGGKSRDGTGLFSLRGTIGQAAVGGMSGGTYNLTGGFWAAPPGKTGDINGDGKVNVVDLLHLADSFGKNEATLGFLAYDDLNDDGNVDVVDLLILAQFWGT